MILQIAFMVTVIILNIIMAVRIFNLDNEVSTLKNMIKGDVDDGK